MMAMMETPDKPFYAHPKFCEPRVVVGKAGCHPSTKTLTHHAMAASGQERTFGDTTRKVCSWE